MTAQRIAAVFQHAALFSKLSPKELRRLAQRATTRLYPTGATIIREGDTSIALYVILAGKVVVEVAGRAPPSIREIGPGGVFGELGLIDDRPRSASVVAIEPTACALLSSTDIRHHPGIALGLLPVLAQRLRDSSARPPTDELTWLAALEG